MNTDYLSPDFASRILFIAFESFKILENTIKPDTFLSRSELLFDDIYNLSPYIEKYGSSFYKDACIDAITRYKYMYNGIALTDNQISYFKNPSKQNIKSLLLPLFSKCLKKYLTKELKYIEVLKSETAKDKRKQKLKISIEFIEKKAEPILGVPIFQLIINPKK